MKLRIRPSAYSRNILTLMAGTTAAQVIPIAISPILTRLFSPSDFGVFAFYFSASIVLSVIATGKYEMAIILPRENEEALRLVKLSIYVAATICVLLFIIVLLFKDLISSLFSFPDDGMLYFLPVSTLIIGVNQSLYYYLNRNKNYRDMATSRVVRSTGTSVFSLVFGVIKASGLGLIVSDLLGQLASTLGMYRKAKNDLRSTKVDRIDLSTLATRYNNFPKFLIVSGLLERLAGQAPVFLLGSFFFSTSIVGFFSLAQRIIISPADLVIRAVSDVFRQQASEAYAIAHDCRKVFITTFKKLLLIAVIPFVVAYFAVEDLFEIIFGPEWRVSGTYAKVMLPMFFLQFITSPLSVMFVIAQKQKYEVALQFFLLSSVTAAFFYGYHSEGSVKTCLEYFTLAYSIKYIVEFSLSYKFTRNG